MVGGLKEKDVYHSQNMNKHDHLSVDISRNMRKKQSKRQHRKGQSPRAMAYFYCLKIEIDKKKITVKKLRL